MSTLLEVVQQLALRTALPNPAIVIGSTDAQILQMQALLQEGCESLSGRGQWQGLINEATWTTTATEDQGALTTLASNGFRYLIPETLWDRTEKLQLLGGISPKDWQGLKAIVITGPRYSFRFRQDHFLVTPAPPAGHTWVFEYVSKNFLLAVDGVTYKASFTADTDTILLPDDIVKADLRWRWKKEKGLTYEEDFNSCEALIADALGRDSAKTTIDMGASCKSVMPGIFIPSGTWNLP